MDMRSKSTAVTIRRSKRPCDPCDCGAYHGRCGRLCYKGVYAVLKMNAVAAAFAILVAVLVYAVALLAMKGLSEEEIRKFPKGYVLVRYAKKFHLL